MQLGDTGWRPEESKHDWQGSNILCCHDTIRPKDTWSGILQRNAHLQWLCQSSSIQVLRQFFSFLKFISGPTTPSNDMHWLHGLFTVTVSLTDRLPKAHTPLQDVWTRAWRIAWTVEGRFCKMLWHGHKTFECRKFRLFKLGFTISICSPSQNCSTSFQSQSQTDSKWRDDRCAQAHCVGAYDDSAASQKSIS